MFRGPDRQADWHMFENVSLDAEPPPSSETQKKFSKARQIDIDRQIDE